MKRLLILALLGLAACVPAGPPVASFPAGGGAYSDPGPMPDAQTAARNFATVVHRMEPVIEAACRERLGPQSCGFQIVVDTTRGAQPNAYQTRDRAGRPILAFTIPLIAMARNQDELAFVMGHEASHHILAHLQRQQQTATLGAAILGAAVAASGGDAGAIGPAQQAGAELAARSYSKEYELEADRLGAVLAWQGGYDPERGAMFFARLPDPGNRFLGSHPPNSQRMQAVAEVAARLRRGGI